MSDEWGVISEKNGKKYFMFHTSSYLGRVFLRVVIIGTGYVGLTTGVALAYLGHQVVGVDKDLRKLDYCKKVKSIHEPGLEVDASGFI